MAVVEVTQYQTVVHIPKAKFRDIIAQEDFDRTELKVFCYLLTVLNGFNEGARSNPRNDPRNFTVLDPEVIADEIFEPKKKIKKAIKRFELLGFLESGSSNSVKNGYRFTF